MWPDKKHLVGISKSDPRSCSIPRLCMQSPTRPAMLQVWAMPSYAAAPPANDAVAELQTFPLHAKVLRSRGHGLASEPQIYFSCPAKPASVLAAVAPGLRGTWRQIHDFAETTRGRLRAGGHAFCITRRARLPGPVDQAGDPHGGG